MKKAVIIFAVTMVFAFGYAVIADIIIDNSTESKLYTSASEIPKHNVGVVLGCSKYLSNGRINTFFKNRISAAVDLYRNNKINYIIVSGDNSRKDYDEPGDMKESLIDAGIPAEHIYCDYAGFRTLDSIVRAKKIFGCDSITVISQKFHNKRAVFIANHFDISAVGFNAEEVSAYNSLKTKIREQIAKAYTLLDLYILDTKPRFYGPAVHIGQNSPESI